MKNDTRLTSGRREDENAGNVPGNPPPVSPKTYDGIARSLVESLPATYLTVVGIIQAVAMGILAEQTFGSGGAVDLPLGRWLLYSLISLGLIAAVTYTYTWVAAVTKWMPDIIDTIGPLLLGYTEVASLFFLKRPSTWWFLTGLFCLTSCVVHLNGMRRSKDMLFSYGPRATALTRGVFRDNAVITFTGFLLSLTAAGVSRINPPYWCFWVYGALFFVGLGSYFWIGEKYKRELCEVPSAGTAELGPESVEKR